MLEQGSKGQQTSCFLQNAVGQGSGIPSSLFHSAFYNRNVGDMTNYRGSLEHNSVKCRRFHYNRIQQNTIRLRCTVVPIILNITGEKRRPPPHPHFFPLYTLFQPVKTAVRQGQRETWYQFTENIYPGLPHFPRNPQTVNWTSLRH